MRPIAIVLVILGILAFSIHSVTYFTTDQVAGPLGFFAWDVQRPQTIFFNPLAGIAALVIGIVLLAMPERRTAL